MVINRLGYGETKKKIIELLRKEGGKMYLSSIVYNMTGTYSRSYRILSVLLILASEGKIKAEVNSVGVLVSLVEEKLKEAKENIEINKK